MRNLLEIDAVVSTVNSLKETELDQAEQQIRNILKRKEYQISPSQIRKTLAAKAAGRPSVKIRVSALRGRGPAEQR